MTLLTTAQILSVSLYLALCEALLTRTTSHRYAFPNDELYPVSNGFGNSRNGWGASAADAFSTALVMGDADIVNIILDYVPTINWSVSYEDEAVSLFETTIRYLGGLLSAHDLLNGPLADLARNKANVPRLLDQAVHLANNLSFAFETPLGVPSNNLYFNNRSTDGSATNGLATIGTLVLEWTRLSDLTGNNSYAQLSQKGEEYLLSPRPAWAQPWPGLVGTNVNISTGQFVDAQGGWNGGMDSFYEYLIKMWVYDSSRFSQYRDRWIAAADSSIAHLASHPSSRPDLTFLAAFDNTTLVYDSSHLACFDGGNFILGGLVLNEEKYTNFGLDLVAACEDTYASTLTKIGPESFSWIPDGGNFSALPANQTAFYDRAGFYITSSGSGRGTGSWRSMPQRESDQDFRRLPTSCEDTYASTLTKIGPESFSWIPDGGNFSALPANQTAFYDRAGFYITSSGYVLRPEVLESFYYAYRATGDRKYQEWSWNGFVAINATTRIGSGFSEVTDVNAPDGGNHTDFQDSFLFAEVLKYAYLIHAPDAEYQVNYQGKNEWVFNTEGHPIKVAVQTVIGRMAYPSHKRLKTLSFLRDEHPAFATLRTVYIRDPMRRSERATAKTACSVSSSRPAMTFGDKQPPEEPISQVTEVITRPR
nr:mannosyl-oligosaccharide alpha-1,2-mannosidase [Quercus suber]